MSSSFKNYNTEVCHGFVTCDVTGMLGTQSRATKTNVTFPLEFSGVPSVTISYAGSQITVNPSNVYFDLNPINITSKGFTVHFQMWGDTKTDFFKVQYVATYYQLKVPPHPFAKFVGKKVNLKNIENSAYLRDNNGVIDLSLAKKTVEEWTIEDAGNGNFNLVNGQFKKYLSSNGTLVGHSSKPPTSGNIDWVVDAVSGKSDTFTFKDPKSNNYLNGLSSFDTEIGTSSPGSEFEVTIA